MPFIGTFFNMSVQKEVKRVTTKTLGNEKKGEKKISMLTAFTISRWRAWSALPWELMSFWLAIDYNVMAGHETTLPITLDQMIYHASSVIHGTAALVVVSLPFGSTRVIRRGAYAGNS
ncbi:MAG: 3-methyl-2-oxobutanoate hydroxymethyltransferase [Bacteroidia bacterium]